LLSVFGQELDTLSLDEPQVFDDLVAFETLSIDDDHSLVGGEIETETRDREVVGTVNRVFATGSICGRIIQTAGGVPVYFRGRSGIRPLPWFRRRSDARAVSL